MIKEELSSSKEIIARLAKLQSDMNYLKEHIEDITLTEDDIKALEEAEEDFKKGRTKRL